MAQPIKQRDPQGTSSCSFYPGLECRRRGRSRQSPPENNNNNNDNNNNNGKEGYINTGNHHLKIVAKRYMDLVDKFV